MRTAFLIFTFGLITHYTAFAQTETPADIYNSTNKLVVELHQVYFDYLIALVHQPGSETLVQQEELYERKLEAMKDWTETIEKTPGTDIFSSYFNRYAAHEYEIEKMKEVPLGKSIGSTADWEVVLSDYKKFKIMQLQSSNLFLQLQSAMQYYAEVNNLVKSSNDKVQTDRDTVIAAVNRALEIHNFTLLFSNPLIGLKNTFGEKLNEKNCTEAANTLTLIKELLPNMRKETASFLPRNQAEAAIIAQLKRTLGMTEAFTDSNKGTMTQMVGVCWLIARNTHTNDDIDRYNENMGKLENILNLEYDKLRDMTQAYLRQCTPTERQAE